MKYLLWLGLALVLWVALASAAGRRSRTARLLGWGVRLVWVGGIVILRGWVPAGAALAGVGTVMLVVGFAFRSAPRERPG
ncbi:MAG: hypothetical protein ACOC5E_01585 [Acidobacteriota bacterium]